MFTKVQKNYYVFSAQKGAYIFIYTRWVGWPCLKSIRAWDISFASPSNFFLAPWNFSLSSSNFLLSAKIFFVTNFVTLVTNLLIRVTNFVIRVTNFVTNFSYRKVKNLLLTAKNISEKVKIFTLKARAALYDSQPFQEKACRKRLYPKHW